ncbi:MAG: hypothetical protein NVS1B14_06210 [Vulcanimicrobiaceae bacterium]
MQFVVRTAPAVLCAILLASPASASQKRHPAGNHVAPRAVPSMEMFSRRARRRAATILQLQLLEMRKAHLERVRKVIEGRLGPGALFQDRPGNGHAENVHHVAGLRMRAGPLCARTEDSCLSIPSDPSAAAV